MSSIKDLNQILIRNYLFEIQAIYGVRFPYLDGTKITYTELLSEFYKIPIRFLQAWIKYKAQLPSEGSPTLSICKSLSYAEAVNEWGDIKDYYKLNQKRLEKKDFSFLELKTMQDCIDMAKYSKVIR